MNDFRRFLLCLPLGLALAFGLYTALFWLQLGAPTLSSRWTYELFERKMRIAAGLKRPALFLLGGSATLFGLNAAQIERDTGLPTVNFGTHAALWPDYIFKQVRPALRAGDTVVLAPEYELYFWNRPRATALAEDVLLDYLVARDPAYLAGLPWRDRFTVFMCMPLTRLKYGVRSRLFGLPARPPEPVYDARWLEGHGDQTHHAGGSDQRKPAVVRRVDATVLRPLPADTRGWEEIRKFCAWAAAHGVRVIAAYPPLARRPEYSPAVTGGLARWIQDGYAKLGVPMLGKPEDAMYADDQFFDSCYHLTEEGASAHTTNLVRLLQAHPLSPAPTAAPGAPPPPVGPPP